MSTTTKKLGLLKPELTDSADITAYNDNWDKIDTKIDAVNTAIEAVNSELDDIDQRLNTVNSKLDNPGVTPVNNGGTGATTASEALDNLGAVSKSTFDTLQTNASQHIANKQNPHGVTAEQIGLVSLSEFPNLYVWKKYDKNPSCVESSVGKQQIETAAAQCAISYSSEVTVSNGVISLVNPTNETISNIVPASFNKLKGKYVENNSRIVYVYPSATITVEDSGTAKLIYASEAAIITVGEPTPLELVVSKESDAYPANGKHTDGYFYKYQSRFGENPYTYGTEDMTAGASALETGKLYFVYE